MAPPAPGPTKKQLIALAKEVLAIEAEGLAALMAKVDDSFARAVQLILKAAGRVILTGVGKSGIVARKIVATLNSTGTRALFLHPVEAMHGDLGMISPGDVVLALSNSGETSELTILLPSLARLGAPLIALTGRPESTLGRASAIVLDVGVPREACPLGLAPTASTTAALAMGDALAVALLTARGFRASDFKRFHPGGALGARLKLAISEVMLTGAAVPMVAPGQPLKEVLPVMDEKRLGAALVVESGNVLVGIITDGDLRRSLSQYASVTERPVHDIMTVDPISIGPRALASEALELMEQKAITVLPVVDEKKKVVGIVHLHDLLGRGEFNFK